MGVALVCLPAWLPACLTYCKSFLADPNRDAAVAAAAATYGVQSVSYVRINMRTYASQFWGRQNGGWPATSTYKHAYDVRMYVSLGLPVCLLFHNTGQSPPPAVCQQQLL